MKRRKRSWARPKRRLAYTELRAGAAGVITARSLEVGQVVQAGQPVFSLAQDGERDAVFDVYESIFFGDFDGGPISLTLVSDPSVHSDRLRQGGFACHQSQRARPSASR